MTSSGGNDDSSRKGLLSARIKLEIPFFKPEAHELQMRRLQEALDMRHFWVGEGIESEMEEPGCQKMFEVNYEISAKDYRLNLLPAIRHFLKSLVTDDFPDYTKGSLVVHSPECYNIQLVTAHMDVKASAVMFGNIQGGVYINHWEVSYDEGGRRTTDNMFVDFEYDRNEIITVKFTHKDRRQWTDGFGADQVKQLKDGTLYNKVTLQRANIRRILVDLYVTDSFGDNRIRLHFELNTPAIIRNAFVPKGQTQNNKFSGPRFERYTNVKKGRTPRGRVGPDGNVYRDPYFREEYPKAAACVDSPIFTIEMAQSMELSDLYDILSRLRMRCDVAIEFASLTMVDCLIGREFPYYRWHRIDRGRSKTEDWDWVGSPVGKGTWDRHYANMMNKCFPAKTGDKKFKELMKCRRFVIAFLIECLLSRGSIVKDQIWLVEQQWKNFLDLVILFVRKDFNACETALERLVTIIDERKRFGSIATAFEKAFDGVREENREAMKISEEEVREGYQRVRKVILTPTRRIYVVPEMLMSNRVLRQYDEDGTNVLRISFRDDDNMAMRSGKTSELLIKRCVREYLINGFIVADRDFGYLGSSNSQMRDHGAYFMVKNTSSDVLDYKVDHPKTPMPKTYMAQVKRVRKQLGRFEIEKLESVPKMMARLGQCFTQSRKSSIELPGNEYGYTYDIIGGSNIKCKDYTFSDGVGMISRWFAQKVAKDMECGKGTPSCYQIRFRGMKGVLCVNPYLDEIAGWAKDSLGKVEVLEGEEAVYWKMHCMFRDSQVKFDGNKKDGNKQAPIEIVKISTPVPVSLNKPFINILDQTSEMQSQDCHRRMCNRIEELLDEQMRGLASMMIDEHHCRNKLRELPRRVDVDKLAERAGFQLSTEPFFRSLIKASVKYSITKQLRKEQIRIPNHLGRSMLGVIDETGRLQSGQIFAQYTRSLLDKFPSPNAGKTVLVGKVLLTKNPCIVPGDVRVFEAVDIPELRHLVDIIVFPQHGPRPHPDEMAGSDLDGDEYTVIWDKQLLLEKNEEPFDFTADKRVDTDVTDENVDEKMAEFYITYMTQDSVGSISNAFLFQSDLYGIHSKVCMQLALKNSQAVDFTKSGKSPDKLTTSWEKDPITDELIPPEKPERNPDFHFGDSSVPVYESARLIGKLYRRIKTIEDVLRISEDKDEQMDIELDPLLTYPGWQEYTQSAAQQLAKYNALLRSAMENYGIRTEAEIFSGCICEMRNRISDKDDMSFYSTDQMIETKVTGIFKRFREEFFEEFGGWRTMTEKVDRPFANEQNVLHRECSIPSEEMKRKAVAYYRMCYDRAATTREKKLSFGWLAYEILASVRQQNYIDGGIDGGHGDNPLWTMLSAHSEAYCKEQSARLETFSLLQESTLGNAVEPIKKYCRKHPGLERLMFLAIEWARVSQVLSRHWDERHLCLVILMFCTNQMTSTAGDAYCVFPAIPPDVSIDSVSLQQPEPLSDPTGVLIRLFELLSSRSFGNRPMISFDLIGYPSLLCRGEWIPMHKAALKTYYNLVFNLRFDELALEANASRRSAVVREVESFCIELPDNVSDDLVRLRLIQKTGVEDVRLRRMAHTNANRVSVSARGTLESLDRLRSAVAVKAPRRTAAFGGKELSEKMVRLVYEQIMRKD